jgi:hypothetical protein
LCFCPEEVTVVMADEKPIFIAPAKYVLLPVAEAITGYTIKAIERKIERGDWIEGKIWIRAPDGRILLNIQGFEKWVEGR